MPTPVAGKSAGDGNQVENTMKKPNHLRGPARKLQPIPNAPQIQQPNRNPPAGSADSGQHVVNRPDNKPGQAANGDDEVMSLPQSLPTLTVNIR